VVRAARAIRIRRARQKRLFDQELALQVPTTPEAIDQVGDIYVRLVSRLGYADEDQVRLESTFREAVGNAAEHGNKKDPARTIHVTLLRTAERVVTVVRDEGAGFDHRTFLARATEVSALEHTRSRRQNEARPGGLGVFIMKETCDQIAFNGSGNAIYLAKRLPGQGAPASS
jgi:anti-sigma regulatory factor (Ser/Thr protein kinase)